MANEKSVQAIDNNNRLALREKELAQEVKALRAQLKNDPENKELEEKLARSKSNLKLVSEQIKAAAALKHEWDLFRKKQHPAVKQSEMAKALGISKPMVSTYLTGRQGMNNEYVLKFAKYLGVEPSAISPYLSKQIGVESFLDVEISQLLSNPKCDPAFKKGMLDLLRLHIKK